MRGLTALLFVGALAGCENDRTFDERYDEAANHIEQRAANLDAEASGVVAKSTLEPGRPKAP